MAIADPKKAAFSLFEEFKNFAFKGNVIDLAVGVIIGGAFGKIVESLVKNVIMPLISCIAGGDPEKATEGIASFKPALNGVQIPVGQFMADVVNFLILAAVLFIFIVKFLGWIMNMKKDETAAPPPPTKDQELLMEIRDLLKQRG